MSSPGWRRDEVSEHSPRPVVPPPPEPASSEIGRDVRVRWFLGGLLIAALGTVVALVLSHFIAALTWATVLAMSLWPLHREIQARLTGWPGLAAALTTVLVTLGLVVPLVVITSLLVGEVNSLAKDVGHGLGPKLDGLQQSLRSLPLGGPWLSDTMAVLRTDTPGTLGELVGEHSDRIVSVAGQTADLVARNVFKLGFALFAVFFLFYNGDSLAAQLRKAGNRVGGERLEVIFQNVAITVRAVVYGLVLTALVQGLCAALGFWAAGVPFPWLLGALTVVLSFVPLGHAVVWAPAAAYLALEGHYTAAFLLAGWGLAVVASVDNVLRPIFIGARAGIPVLLVFIGVLGGILSFGLVGLFVGPVAIAVTLALWNEWIGST